ncbi:hypothetical protein MMC31_001738, partial [Peltigera leucophlebia]|nr:hypothetical protein [Peltigera leucophlebia]
MATSRIGGDADSIDGITSRLTQTNLAEDSTRPAVEPPTGKAEIDAITTRLGQAVLKEDRTEEEADKEEDEDSLFLPEGPISEEVRQRQAAEAAAKAAAAKQKEEDEQTSSALSAACDMWSIENNEEAKAKREAQQIQERLQQEHANRMQELEAAEASRRADADHAAAWKKWVEGKAQARLIEANRAAQEAKDEEAGQKLAEADALAIQQALEREALERELQEQARANQVKEEADNKLRQELSQARDSIIAELNAASAKANTWGWQNWQQQQAESLARYEAIFSGQAENATVLEQQQHHHQQQQPQQHVGCFFFEDMETTPDEEAGEETFRAMDTTSNTEGTGETIMDWEPVEEVMPMPAQPRLPLVPLTDPVVLFASNSISGSGLDSQMPDVDAISSGTAIGAVVGTVTVARSNGQKKEIIPSATSTKHHAKSKAKKASLPRCFGQSATVVPTAAFAAGLAKSPRLPSFGEALKALRAGSLTPKSPPSTVPPPSPPLAPLPLPPPPLSPLLAPLLSPPPPPLPPPALLPLPPPPQKVLKVVLPRAPICPVTRPTIHPWSPLSRLSSRGQPFPQVAHEQVLGKRERADKDEVGPETKKAKLEGEFQYQVGGKRK